METPESSSARRAPGDDNAVDRLVADGDDPDEPTRLYARRVLLVAQGLADLRRGEMPCWCGWCGRDVRADDIDLAERLVSALGRVAP